MLIKSKRLDKVILYRKGIGYFLKLLQYMNENDVSESYRKYLFGEITECPTVSREVVIYALRAFTNIKDPQKYSRDIKKSMGLLAEIIKFNVPAHILQGQKSGTQKNIDETAAGIIDNLSSEYGWLPEYILDSIDYFTYCQINDTIQARKANEYSMRAIITHDPKQLQNIINRMSGIEVVTWEELKARRQKK